MMKLCSFWKALNLQQTHVGRLSQAKSFRQYKLMLLFYVYIQVWMSDFEMSKEQGIALSQNRYVGLKIMS